MLSFLHNFWAILPCTWLKKLVLNWIWILCRSFKVFNIMIMFILSHQQTNKKLYTKPNLGISSKAQSRNLYLINLLFNNSLLNQFSHNKDKIHYILKCNPSNEGHKSTRSWDWKSIVHMIPFRLCMENMNKNANQWHCNASWTSGGIYVVCACYF